MPDYKKKKVNRLRGAPKPKKAKHSAMPENEDIVMTHTPAKRRSAPKKAEKPLSNMRVVNGNKLERKRKLSISFSAVAVVAIITIVLHLILPVGIFENVQNLSALIGSGSYPADINSAEVLNAVSRGNYYYVLTDTRLSAYSNGGKEIYSYSHGFENPVLKTSKTRAMIFSQGGNEAYIYNLANIKSTISTEKEIITANISDSGTYALVTRSDSYASVVSVYNKNNKLVYEWYSSEDTVNNVAISPSGKKIAVSAFNATSGDYRAKLSVLTFDSATPEYTESYSGLPVYGIEAVSNARFSVITENGIQFIKWSNFKKAEYKNDYSAAMFRSSSGRSVAVFNRSSDKTDNRIAVFNSKGRLKGEFEFKGIISDIEIKGGHIYCISDTYAYLLSENGEVLRKAECGFGAVRISVTGTNSVAVITDNQIYRIQLER